MVCHWRHPPETFLTRPRPCRAPLGIRTRFGSSSMAASTVDMRFWLPQPWYLGPVNWVNLWVLPFYQWEKHGKSYGKWNHKHREDNREASRDLLTENPEEKRIWKHVCGSFRPVLVGTHPVNMNIYEPPERESVFVATFCLHPRTANNISSLSSRSVDYFCFKAASAEHSLAFLCWALVFDPQLTWHLPVVTWWPEVVIKKISYAYVYVYVYVYVYACVCMYVCMYVCM